MYVLAKALISLHEYADWSGSKVCTYVIFSCLQFVVVMKRAAPALLGL